MANIFFTKNDFFRKTKNFFFAKSVGGHTVYIMFENDCYFMEYLRIAII